MATIPPIDLMAILACALLLAKLVGGVSERWGIPSVLSELMVGVILGNFTGNLGNELDSHHLTHSLSELGALFLLFLVGLETDIREIGKVGLDASMAAVAGVIAPFALAFAALPLVGPSPFQHTLFIAATLAATSVGITARVLQDSGKLGSVSGQIILGAAVIDDVLGIIVLALVSALLTQGSVSGQELAWILLKIAGFGFGVWILRKLVLNPMLPAARPLEVSGTVTIILLSVCLLSAWFAEKAGLAGIIGAFAAGIALDDVHFEGYRQTEKLRIDEIIRPVSDFLVPIFFIAMGMSVKIRALLNPEAARMAGLLIACAIAGKLVCGWALRRSTLSRGADRLLVGLGMMPRGEVGLIFAAMGMKLKVLTEADYAAVVGMVAITTLLAPGLIQWRAKRIPA